MVLIYPEYQFLPHKPNESSSFEITYHFVRLVLLELMMSSSHELRVTSFTYRKI